MARNLTKSLGVEYEEEPSLIDFSSNLQASGIPLAASSSLGFPSDLSVSSQSVTESNLELGDFVGGVGELLNTRPSEIPSLLDGLMAEDLPLSPDLDGLLLPSPQRSPHLNRRQVVEEAPQEDGINESQPQEPLFDSQDDSRATSIHGEDSAENTVEGVAQGIDSGNTDQAAGL